MNQLPNTYIIMQIRLAIALAAGILAGCASPTVDTPPQTAAKPPANKAPRVERAEAPPTATSKAASLDAYKRELASHIAQLNSKRVFSGRPQALLRSVVVVRYVVDGHGRLLHSDILRSNRDRETEATALATLRKSAPFPSPGAHLMRRGQVEISETWLFNNDGRFQLRTIAERQMNR